jgi:hypothetical protein
METQSKTNGRGFTTRLWKPTALAITMALVLAN